MTDIKAQYHLRSTILIGLALAGLYSLYAIALVALRGQAPVNVVGTTLGRVIGSYFAGGILGGAAVGLFCPMSRHRGGATVIGILAAFAAIVAIRWSTVGALPRWSTEIWISSVVAAVLLGALTANFIWCGPSKAGDRD
jgi:hypothetical protein